MRLRCCCFIIRVDFILRSCDSHSYECLVSGLQEFNVLKCLAMLIELYWVHECDECMNDESIIL